MAPASLAIVIGAQIAQTTRDSTLARRVAAYLDEACSAEAMPMLAVAIVRKDGPTLQYACGARLGPTGNSEHRFGIGSLSKAFTAMLVEQLVDRGRLSFDDSLAQQLPDALRETPGARAITVRQLLDQTSGIPKAAGFWFGDRRDAGALERRVLAARVSRLNATPGSAFEYSNLNYDLLGLIVQRAAHRPYAKVLQEEIIAPLNLLHTGVVDEPGAHLDVGWQRYWGMYVQGSERVEASVVGPSGAIVSTTADMALWAAALLRRDTLLLPARIFAALAGARPGGYSSGWVHGSVDGIPARRHDGATPSFTSSIVLSDVEGIAIVALSASNAVLITQPATAFFVGEDLLRLARNQSPQFGYRRASRVDHFSVLIALLLTLLTVALCVVLVRRGVRWWIFLIAAAVGLCAAAVGLRQMSGVPLLVPILYVPDLGLALAAALLAPFVAFAAALARRRRSSGA